MDDAAQYQAIGTERDHGLALAGALAARGRQPVLVAALGGDAQSAGVDERGAAAVEIDQHLSASRKHPRPACAAAARIQAAKCKASIVEE